MDLYVTPGDELPLQARLIEYLLSREDVRIIGPNHSDPSRVPTISFVHSSKSSAEITEVVDRSGIGIRHGHMYAYHLCEALGLDLSEAMLALCRRKLADARSASSWPRFPIRPRPKRS